MTTQQRIDKITEELRDIYKNTNEGPRLIAEMVKREFPVALDLANRDLLSQLECLEEELDELEALRDAEE